MATAVIMPKMGMTMEEGTIVRWQKREGEHLDKGEPLLVIETDKVTMDIEAPASGVLQEVTAKPNTTVPVGQIIAYIMSDGEAPPPPSQLEATAIPSPPSVASAPQRATVREPTLASPLARKLAHDAGLDLRAIRGTGPAGRIVEADVRAAFETQATVTTISPQATASASSLAVTTAQVSPAAAPKAQRPAPVAGRILALSSKRKTIAQRMVLSASIPQFALGVEADMTQAGRARGNCSLTAVLVRVAACALQHHAMVNASFAEDSIRLNDDINIGVAVSVDDGFVVPVVKNADGKRLLTLDAEIRDLAERARSGTQALNDVSGATFTVSNLGMLGIEEFRALINPPEVAILALGRVTPKPVAVHDHVVVRPMLRLVVSADHRVLDGGTVAAFLVDVRQMLENPYLLF